MRPLIGITGRQLPYGSIEGCPAPLAEAMLDIVLVDYVDAVLASGGLPVHLPMSVDPAEFAGRLDGLILSGGADIDPAQYGAGPDPDLESVDPDRDAFELAMAQIAIQTSMPTLGICRGIQVLNVAAGGTLVQHRPDHARFDSAPDADVHAVTIDADSVAGAAYGIQHDVNSFHHQVVGDVGAGIRVVGRADDGDIEAIEFDNKPIVGIQWHPEMYRRQDPIFDWLVEAAAV
jgi:putative glutamine amidotransferase